MRFGCWVSTDLAWPDLQARADAARAAGFDGVWAADHFMPNHGDLGQPMLECFAVLAGLAATVPQVRLGSLVAGNTYRHPAVLANQAATIDHVAGGRFVLGLGAGWQVGEHEAYGIPLFGVKERIDRFEEACQVVLALRDEPRASFAGEAYQLADAPMEPKPLGPMPLLIGSSGPHRMARIVARYADEWNTWGTAELFAEKAAHVDRACVEADRDPASLVRSSQALVFLGPDGAAAAERTAAFRPSIGGTTEQLAEVVAAYAAAGVDELIIPDFTLGDQAQVLEAIDQLGRELLPAAR